VRSSDRVPPPIRARPRRAFHFFRATDSTVLRDQPGSSTSRFRVALPALTKEIPTFMSTTRLVSASKEAKAPQAVPAQLLAPGVTTGPVPAAHRREGPVEAGREIQRVVRSVPQKFGRSSPDR